MITIPNITSPLWGLCEIWGVGGATPPLIARAAGACGGGGRKKLLHCFMSERYTRLPLEGAANSGGSCHRF